MWHLAQKHRVTHASADIRLLMFSAYAVEAKNISKFNFAEASVTLREITPSLVRKYVIWFNKLECSVVMLQQQWNNVHYDGIEKSNTRYYSHNVALFCHTSWYKHTYDMGTQNSLSRQSIDRSILTDGPAQIYQSAAIKILCWQ